jgi:hypothetical protein
MDATELGYAGADLALHIFAGLELVGVRFEGSHPPAEERLQAIRKELRSLCQSAEAYASVTQLSNSIDAVFANILRRIAAPDYEEFLDRAAREVMDQLEMLLDQCAGGPWPDYVTFKSQCFPLFNQLHSAQLWKRIAHASRDFFRRLDRRKKARRPSGVEVSENWTAFQKYKLFMSAIRAMPQEMRALFDDALGRERDP